MRKESMKQQNFVIYSKTYRGDFDAFSRMFSSYLEYNKDNIPLYISTPESDVEIFQKLVGDNATVVPDESYAKRYFSFNESWGLSTGYLNQEICKLSFWETGIALNYLCVDSDVCFIRNFYVRDFMASEKVPYSVLVQDKELLTQDYYVDYGRERTAHIQKIFQAVGLNDPRLLTCHGMTVLNQNVLMDMKDSFMKSNGYEYIDLINISPFEYTWYNAWLQKSKIIPIMGVEPFFKTFHMREEYLLWRTAGVTLENLSTQYVGVILNSNWKPIGPPLRYANPSYVSKLLKKAIWRWG